MEARRAEREKEKPNSKPDDGEWFRIAHEIYRALYSTREMDKTQIKMMHWCIHKTWGVKGRRSFIFTTAEAAKELGLDKAQIRRAKDTLIEANMLIKVDKDGNEIRVNKYPDTWDVGILQGKRVSDTQRRKSYETKGEDTSPSVSDDEGGGYVPPRGRIRPPFEEDTSPLDGLKPAREANHGGPIDKIDNLVDIPPIVPLGGRGEGSSMPTKYDPLYRFDEWYKRYPVKKDRGCAERAWTKLVKLKEFDDAFVDRLIAAVDTQRKIDPNWKRGYIKNPGTWLNAKAWMNEYDAELPMAANGGPARRQSADDVVNAWLKGAGD